MNDMALWAEYLREPWKAVPNDLVGGWCTVLDREDRTPAAGAVPIADFMDRDTAHHVARCHNNWIEHVHAVTEGRTPKLDYDPEPAPD